MFQERRRAVPCAPVNSGRARDTFKHLIPRVYIPTFVTSFGQGMLLPTLPLFLRDILRDPATDDVNVALVTLPIAMAGVGTLIANVPSGAVLTRISERAAQLISLALIAATVIALAVEPPYPVLIALRLLTGAGLSLWGLSRMQYMLRMTPLRQRGRIMSLFGGVNRIGGAFAGPAVGGVVASVFGYGALFGAAGVIIGAAMIPSVWHRESRMDPSARVALTSNPLRGLGRVLRNHRYDLVTAGSGHIFASTIRAGRPVVLPLYGALALDLDPAAVGIALSASGAIDMVMFPLAGYVMDNFGRKFAIVPSFTLFSAAMALLSLVEDFTGLILIGLLIGFANGIGSGSMLTLGSDLAPRDQPSEFLGVWRLLGDIGHTGGPAVVGGAAELFGLALAPLFLAGIGLAGALTFGLFVRETLTRRPSTAEAEP